MKEERIKLSHPEGENAVNITVEKYTVIKDAIMQSLANNAALTHTELFQAVKDHLQQNNIIFKGAVEWYMESVKLDLEANKII